jgi:hypothetical protein
LHAGLDLSSHRPAVYLLLQDGTTVAATTAPPDLDGLRGLVGSVARTYGKNNEVLAVIESINGARFVHDTLDLYGWSVEIADA